MYELDIEATSFVIDQVPHMTSLNFTNIQTLTGSNFKKWKEDVKIVLGLIDLDLALREERPAALTAESTMEQRAAQSLIQYSKGKWGINELISMCAQEEDWLKSDKIVNVNFVQAEKHLNEIDIRSSTSNSPEFEELNHDKELLVPLASVDATRTELLIFSPQENLNSLQMLQMACKFKHNSSSYSPN
ncbi:uncharacterized protein LOC126633930 [Malus sylvestris]|uniref:uncharacterized protein LOC126633930 n=1 Tax=Malus sylvestris TaxID=3752 RepID=UPI0021AC34B0|nr:uncharacterized protein LOC126633930 [Malus sylvestris]